ncbi:hypothetical protein PHYSODRAFT_306323 [Phytophthora sojae]|uniref:Uncharacterized protein n=1 Tax=Phytophthora sojae (strain P6497) TaxID=1094619 RepID=G5A932_PHYSP|nr:hypothetical protein PHYSODRAFT_306323 [Phytophthora sojae]EGZ08408.1 hypothetical protein PHYSODRAFT_306323 [Phytophthora sojae]|eukprot:XP_009536580.1 hypothetical protein PHYSODRAFT_306323 [Phytophthora sojae]
MSARSRLHWPGRAVEAVRDHVLVYLYRPAAWNNRAASKPRAINTDESFVIVLSPPQVWQQQRRRLRPRKVADTVSPPRTTGIHQKRGRPPPLPPPSQQIRGSSRSPNIHPAAVALDAFSLARLGGVGRLPACRLEVGAAAPARAPASLAQTIFRRSATKAAAYNAELSVGRCRLRRMKTSIWPAPRSRERQRFASLATPLTSWANVEEHTRREYSPLGAREGPRSAIFGGALGRMESSRSPPAPSSARKAKNASNALQHL